MSDNITPVTRPCKLCGSPTTGSIGAAGIPWPLICQPCKDEEDTALAERVKTVNAAVRLVEKAFSYES